MTKLQDIRPKVWAKDDFYTNDGSGNPWRTGASPTKVEPPDSVYLAGNIPESPTNAEYDNYIKNQTSNAWQTLALDRMGDFLPRLTAAAGNLTSMAPFFDPVRKLWISNYDVPGADRLSVFGADFLSRLQGAQTTLDDMSLAEGGFSSVGSKLVIGKGNAWNIFDAGSAWTRTTGTLAAGYTFEYGTRPIETSQGLLFLGILASNMCIIRYNGTAFSYIALPVPQTTSLPRFYVEPSGKLWLICFNNKSFSSLDGGLTWTATSGSASNGNAIHDPLNAIWRKFTNTGTDTVVATAAGPAETATTVRTIAGYAFASVCVFGRYTYALATSQYRDQAGALQNLRNILVSGDYGATWNVVSTYDANIFPAAATPQVFCKSDNQVLLFAAGSPAGDFDVRALRAIQQSEGAI